MNLFYILVLSPTILSLSLLPIPDKSADAVKKQYDSFSEKYLLPQDFDLAEMTPVKQPTEKEMDEMQNSQLFEGDIMGVPSDEDPTIYLQRDLPLEDYDSYDHIFSKPYYSSLNLATYPDKLWIDGKVPYMLEEGMTPSQRAAIAQAFEEYKSKTCIRFEPRTENDEDYIFIKRNRGFGCSSYVGRAGGNQTVSLEIGKCFSKGIIAHELMHSIGFFHEHSRTDRDDFVEINEDNIRPGMMRNFEKYPRKIIDPLGMPYDYESVMHYHKLAFSKNGKPTLIPRDEHVEIGQRYKLSDVDAKKINKLYQCMEYSVNKPKPTEEILITTTVKSKITKKPEKERFTRWPVKKQKTTPPISTTTFIIPTTSDNTIIEELTTEKVIETTTKIDETTKNIEITTKTKSNNIDKEKCEDLNAHCTMWEQLGHCQHSTKYMKHYCRKACNFCENTLPETSAETNEKKINEINNNKVNIKVITTSTIKPHKNNKKTKKGCVDKNLFCGYWAKIGECKTESKFMKIFCKQSCHLC
ncbi:Astacin-like metalloendopeptidase [Strongyloides ratti]|uniref:Metalloendopeptidase n=1 Tax=Strongyloides ratti TaxID=34506 RepID=A0A090N117_STRRB|nr:Astacin-like metalloendopeptidase [Strongyloides ratti]CEF71658.1 Astacin-like metalloendopeptidase [Strongyloides ratti]